MTNVVDRTYENKAGLEGDSIVKVALSDGFEIKFWEPGLTDEEYIDRAEIIRDYEAKDENI